MTVQFKKYQGRWHVQGPADELESGSTVEVSKRDGSTAIVTVSEVIQSGNGQALAKIEGEQQTTRERKEAKADRLREWADSREAKGDAARQKADQIADMIPFGQPILIGHHSEGRARKDAERIHNGMRQSVEHSRKADDMRSRADGIGRQLDRSIYSDDEDAIEKLAERIAELEAERGRIKAYNASCRKGARDLSLLDEKQKQDLLTVAKVASYQLGDKGEFPRYVLTNLGGNINRNKKRLEELTS